MGAAPRFQGPLLLPDGHLVLLACLQRAEKLASVNPRRFGQAGTAYSLMLSMHCRYGEAEETMRQVMRTYDRWVGGCAAVSPGAHMCHVQCMSCTGAAPAQQVSGSHMRLIGQHGLDCDSMIGTSSLNFLQVCQQGDYGQGGGSCLIPAGMHPS